ncbi:tRNA pseudouridine(65) synthase TruC [Thiomicrolovo sp. ZZH C-3]
MDEPLEILYRDAWLVAVNKPSGLLVHRSWIDKDETRFALQLVRDQIGQYVYPVHRLDKPTSGVLLFALDPDTARKVGEIFEAGSVRKEYLAVVRGYSDEEGRIDYPLKELLDKMTDAKARTDKEAQEAVTDYERLATVELPIPVGRYQTARYSLVRLRPETGRKHQLRRHMKHLLHPIVGDTKYGRTEHNNLFREHFNCHRLLLASTKLELPHPVTGEPLCIAASVGEVFEAVMAQFGWHTE